MGNTEDNAVVGNAIDDAVCSTISSVVGSAAGRRCCRKVLL